MISDEVLKVIKENEGIPVYAYVDGEVVSDNDAPCRWLGKVSVARVAELAILEEPYGWYGSTVLDRDDIEDYIQYLLDCHDEWDKLEDEEALRLANEEVNKLDFKKVILLNIDTV